MTTHRRRTTVLWIALSIAGLVIAVGGSYAASRLSKPKVGLASEPLSGVEQLAPAHRPTRRPQKPARTVTVTTPATTPPPQTTQTQTTPPSHGEEQGEGGGGGHGEDD